MQIQEIKEESEDVIAYAQNRIDKKNQKKLEKEHEEMKEEIQEEEKIDEENNSL